MGHHPKKCRQSIFLSQVLFQKPSELILNWYGFIEDGCMISFIHGCIMLIYNYVSLKFIRNQPKLHALVTIHFKIHTPYSQPSVILCSLCSLHVVGCCVSIHWKENKWMKQMKKNQLFVALQYNYTSWQMTNSPILFLILWILKRRLCFEVLKAGLMSVAFWGGEVFTE